MQKSSTEQGQLSNLHFLLSYPLSLFLIFSPFFLLCLKRLQVLLLAYLSSLSFTKICLSACQTTQLEIQKQFRDDYFSPRIAPKKKKEHAWFLLSWKVPLTGDAPSRRCSQQGVAEAQEPWSGVWTGSPNGALRGGIPAPRVLEELSGLLGD